MKVTVSCFGSSLNYLCLDYNHFLEEKRLIIFVIVAIIFFFEMKGLATLIVVAVTLWGRKRSLLLFSLQSFFGGERASRFSFCFNHFGEERDICFSFRYTLGEEGASCFGCRYSLSLGKKWLIAVVFITIILQGRKNQLF